MNKNGKKRELWSQEKQLNQLVLWRSQWAFHDPPTSSIDWHNETHTSGDDGHGSPGTPWSRCVQRDKINLLRICVKILDFIRCWLRYASKDVISWGTRKIRLKFIKLRRWCEEVPLSIMFVKLPNRATLWFPSPWEFPLFAHTACKTIQSHRVWSFHLTLVAILKNPSQHTPHLQFLPTETWGLKPTSQWKWISKGR